jgi:apolipoprotein N-acyltransferase
MKPVTLAHDNQLISNTQSHILTYGLVFLAGLIGPLGFAPFHYPGCTLLSIAFLFFVIQNCGAKKAFRLGFTYGMAYFGLGVSWVIVSIHDYGQMNYLLSTLITCSFLMYLSLFPACVAALYTLLHYKRHPLISMFAFCSLWCLFEWLRAHFLTGFPWLLTGTTQIDTPLKYLAPYVGVYGLSFFTALSACSLVVALSEPTQKRLGYLTAFVLILIAPFLLKPISWTHLSNKSISVGGIQANLSMRDKWDEALFWNMLAHYKQTTDTLWDKKLIILPESAIPLPSSYLNDYLHQLHEKALKAKSALLLGILQPANNEETQYFNSMMSLGMAKGRHAKYQLVPFGEYIPKPFIMFNRLFGLPEPNITPGKKKQSLIKVFNYPIASLICYEIAYPNLLRAQMPDAQWIVSISDNGWFGKSLASYQQLQMSQFLSLITGRFQVVVNNDGLSSVINTSGDLMQALPAFSSGVLHSVITPATGSTPWIILGDYPALIFCAMLLFFILFFQMRRIIRD